MRSLTDAQKRELQSYFDFREIVEVGSLKEFTTYHKDADGDRDTGLNLNGFGLDVNPFEQGVANAFHVTFDINNAEAITDIIDYNTIAEADYWDDEVVTVKLEFNDNSYTVGVARIKNWTVTRDNWNFDCSNDFETYNIDLLEENNDRTESALPDESIGTFKPKVFSSSSTNYKFPAIPIRAGIPKLHLCDHQVDDAGIASTDIYIYIPSGDVYGQLNNVLGGSYTTGAGETYYEFFDSRIQITAFKRWIPGPDHTVSLNDLSNILDESTGTAITVGAGIELAVIPELNLTGVLEDPTTYVTYGIGCNNITNTPQAGLYDIVNSNYPVGGHPFDITGNHTWNGPAAMTLADLQNYEVRIASAAGESVDVFEMTITIIYRPFGKVTKEYNRYYQYLRSKNK